MSQCWAQAGGGRRINSSSARRCRLPGVVRIDERHRVCLRHHRVGWVPHEVEDQTNDEQRARAARVMEEEP